MHNRDTGVLALGRFLAVERYCQSTYSPSTHPPVPSSRPDPIGGPAATPAPASGSGAPARPGHGAEFPASRYAPRRPVLRS
jgi:hypothetical protein